MGLIKSFLGLDEENLEDTLDPKEIEKACPYAIECTQFDTNPLCFNGNYSQCEYYKNK